MSAAFTTLVITNQGNAMTAQAWAASGVITITSVQFGTGFPGVSDNIPGYTAIKTPITNGQITGSNVLVPGQCTIRCNLKGTTIPSTFQINELGIFASFAGGASQLVAYCSTGAATGDTLTLGTAVVKDYALLVTFNQGVITSVNISLLQTVGLHAPNHLDNGIDPIPLANTARTGLVPKSTNTGLNVLADTTPISWVPAVLVISVNLTLYVSTTGNNATAIPNDPAHPWLTIQGAMNYLNKYAISNGVTITIQVAAGLYVGAGGTVAVNHVNGSQIVINGPNNPDATFTGILAPTGSTGNWLVQYTGVSSTANMAVNGYVSVWFASSNANTSNTLLTGFFQISGISGTTVTLKNPYGLNLVTVLNINSGGYMTPITALLIPNVNTTAMSVSNGGLGSCSYIGAVPAGFPTSNNVAHGFFTPGCSARFIRCGAANFVNNTAVCAGFVASSTAGNMRLEYCTATNNNNGFLCGTGAAMSLSSCAGSHNANYGIWVDSGGKGYVSPADTQASDAYTFIGGNGTGGAAIANGATLFIIGQFVGGASYNGALWVSFSGSYGVYVTTRAQFGMTGGSGANLINNVSYDVFIDALSLVTGTSHIVGTRVFNQSVGVLGPSGAMFI